MINKNKKKSIEDLEENSELDHGPWRQKRGEQKPRWSLLTSGDVLLADTNFLLKRRPWYDEELYIGLECDKYKPEDNDTSQPTNIDISSVADMEHSGNDDDNYNNTYIYPEEHTSVHK